MKIYIYAIYFPITNKYYIGQTYNIEKRMKAHFKSGSLVCKALWKYDDWQISILHTCKSRDEANCIEIEEIRNFNSIALNGYNLTSGGEGGNYWKGKKNPAVSESNKRRKGEKHPTQSEFMKGRKASKKALKAMRKAQNRPEVKAKKSKAMIGNQNSKGKNKGEDNPFYGKHHSKEVIEKIRKANQGRKHTEKTKLKMKIA